MSLPKFESEELLRQVLAKLFMRMPEISEVQILHGQMEYGKDIVFWTKGALGEPVACACVVKNSRVSGSVGKAGGLRAVFDQIEQALDTPFLDQYGQEQRIHHVYVISPEVITQAAIASLQGKLASRAGQVVFVPGEKLFDLLRTYWMDFFVDEFTQLEESLRLLEEEGQKDDLREVAANYGLKPPDDFERTIYVLRSLHLEVGRWDVSFLRTPVPEFKTDGDEEDLEPALQFLKALRRNLPHLHRWRLIDADHFSSANRDDGVEALASEIGSFVGEVERALRSRRSSVEQLAGKADRLRPRIFLAVSPMRAAARTSSEIGDLESASLEDFRSQSAQMAQCLTDCLSSAPYAMLDRVGVAGLGTQESQVRESRQSWMILGPAGYGKTSFCRWNALIDTERYRSRASEVFPVFIPLNVLARRAFSNYRDAFLKGIGRSALLPEGPTVDGGKGMSVRLYLDGLDEVSSLETRRQICAAARDAHENGLQVILTARDYVRMPELAWLPKLQLSLLDRESQRDLAFRVLGSEAECGRFFEQLNSTAALRDLFGVPLLARLILLTYKETREVPENRSGLYRTFADLLAGGWDFAKRVARDSQFSRREKKNVLCRLARTAQETRVRHFKVDLVKEAVQRSAGVFSDDEVEQICVELVRDGLLAHSANVLYFPHLSFQEFFCASYFMGMPAQAVDPSYLELSRRSDSKPGNSSVSMALREYLKGDDWWREVLAFYIGLSESPEEMAEWLVKSIAGNDRGDRLLRDFVDAFPRYDLAASFPTLRHHSVLR
ncbi:MAG: hypothetical protein AAF604_09430 [Acidobacteriota bacterium]